MTIIEDRGADVAGTMLGTRYRRYSSACGISGLYRLDGEKLNLLVVDASAPGTGQFREFIRQCKAGYQTICVWGIHNPFLGLVLTRYGFAPETEIQGDGEVLEGMRWDRS